jgi:hypothetical protein
MATKFTLVFDCADPERLTHFWAEALAYQIEPPPSGFESWKAFWMSKGVPEKEAGEGVDSLIDPGGAGPRIWFHQVEEGKAVKNRLHIDLNVSDRYAVSKETRQQQIHTAAERLERLGATQLEVLEQEGVDHYAIAMLDPEGNEFDVN